MSGRWQRAKLRGRRRRLSPRVQKWADSVLPKIWSEHQDVGKATAAFERLVESQKVEMGFDPATVILMIRLAILVFEVLKSLGYLSVTEDQLLAIMEDEVLPADSENEDE